ncbi:MAG: ROK family glucokinase [Clostridiales bacterium]|nr:ROK family glucokinase [Clostridiales bacterium]
MFYIGIDLGGTHIAAGVTDSAGRILARDSTPTRAERPYQAVIADMAACALSALDQSGHSLEEVAALGVGIPGIAQNDRGVVIFCTNLGWEQVPLREELQRYIDKPVFIDNDATLAGLAESMAGVSRGASSSVFLTLGTGVGGGIIFDGKPWTGAHGVASELGHLTLALDGVPCTCGKDGCLERYCSATALIRLAKEALAERPDSQMLRLAGSPEGIDGKLVIDCARAGDPAALAAFERYTRYLALAINTIVSFIDPQMIVLGGGISQAGAFLLDAVRAKIPQYLMFKTMPFGRVELAVLGNSAGIIGAAMLGKVLKEGESL